MNRSDMDTLPIGGCHLRFHPGSLVKRFFER